MILEEDTFSCQQF